MLLVNRRLGPKSDHVRTARFIHSAERTFTRFAWFPTLAFCVLVVVVVVCCCVLLRVVLGSSVSMWCRVGTTFFLFSPTGIVGARFVGGR